MKAEPAVRRGRCRRFSPAWLLVLAFGFGGCAAPAPADRHSQRDSVTEPRWHAPLPSASSDLDALQGWWKQFRDPVLDHLQGAAQAVNGSLALAKARIAQAQAERISAGSGALPGLEVSASANRGAQVAGTSVALRNLAQILAGASWELDLFGGVEASISAADARLSARTAEWHDARISVAAEVGSAYLGYRLCQQGLALDQADTRSRESSDQASQAAYQAGWAAAGDAALSAAGLAQSRERAIARQAECEVSIKGLVALTGLSETTVREALAKSAELPTPPHFNVNQVPAHVLARRPDVYAAERDWHAALSAIDVAYADRFPRLSLLGAVGPISVRSGGETFTANTWSFGPSVSLPIFDAGRRKAVHAASIVQAEAANALWRARVLQAVKEVEQALVRLNALEVQEREAGRAATSYDKALEAALARVAGGFGNQLELEETRRLTLAAQSRVLALRAERVGAWIALYRAVGGGWQAETGQDQ